MAIHAEFEIYVNRRHPVTLSVSPESMKLLIRRQIFAAFPITGMPNAQDAIAETYLVEHLYEHLGGRTWDKPTVQEYRYCEDRFCLLTVEGLKYYLPGYLVAELDDPETADVIAQNVTYTLGGQSSFDKARLFELGEMVTENQIAAISLWLGYYAFQYGVNKHVCRSYDTLTEWANISVNRSGDSR